MIRAYAVSTVREAEAGAAAELALSGQDTELMARAAAALAAVASTRLAARGRGVAARGTGLGGPAGVKGRSVVAIVGAGNNGGDALYALASLARDGATAAVLTVAQTVHEDGILAARAAGALVLNAVDAQADAAATVSPTVSPTVSATLREADLVIDGIVGLGGRPGLSPQIEALLAEVSDTAYILAVDLPSGADPDGEVAARSCVFADETVTFIAAKPVHLLPATEPAVGRLTVVDIGVEIGVVPGQGPVVERLTRQDVGRLWPRPEAPDDKYSRGVLGIVAGGETYTGAALLAVTSAVCSGAGMVRYMGPPTPTMLIRAQVPEAVIGEGQVQAWVIGPGVDVTDQSASGREQRAVAQSALDSGLPCVVDAGCLDLIIAPRTAPTLLTPHAGELAAMVSRLEGPDMAVDRATVTSAPVAYARRLADLTNSTVLLKGATSLVVSPSLSGVPLRSQADAPPWLATAGSGDVLAGLAGTLLASGLTPLDAGSVAALVHGLAGNAANPAGPVRALGVAHAIPGVVAALLVRRGARS